MSHQKPSRQETKHLPAPPPDWLDHLARQLEEAKKAENHARTLRIAAEQALIEQLGVADEGSQSFTGVEYKITTTGRLNRTLDTSRLEQLTENLPQDVMKACIRYKPELVTSALKALQQLNPQHYSVLSSAITTKPGKAAVKVERQSAHP